MTSGFIMDHGFASRPFWSEDRRPLQDVCTTVVVTRPIARGASFGPCLLQSSFFDTIAFIALKACDRITKSYVFRIDPEGMRNSTLVLSWLRLVQAARNRQEQNTEAYLKAGQLYVRATRDIRPEEELLVWYDGELSHLLGFSDVASAETHGELRCVRCHQAFEHEHPYLAHCRLMCAHIRSHTCAPKDAHKPAELKRQRRVTDFHNIARDLERKHTGAEEEHADAAPGKRRCEESVSPRGRKSVLLEKTNTANDDNITPSARGRAHASPHTLKTPTLDSRGPAAVECDARFTRGRERAPATDGPSGVGGVSAMPLRSACAPSPSGLQAPGEQRSAFCRPSRRPDGPPAAPPAVQPGITPPPPPSGRLNGISGPFSPRIVPGFPAAPTLMAPARSLASGELALNASFHCGPEPWPRGNMAAARPGTTSSLAALPPTYSSLGVSVQNWCAKCNLSFRMTSDLVFHMRSHHKKEFAAESQVRRRREEKLTCPICHEFFRERHHLSRHMTSHN